MTTVAKTPVGSPSDWAGSPLSTMHKLPHHALSIRAEQYPDAGSYVIRLEIPGVDAERDLTVSVEAGALTVRAERRYTGPDASQSEFGYGTLSRTLALPLGADTSDVSASYRNGILTVRVGMQPEHRRSAQRVPVRVEP